MTFRVKLITGLLFFEFCVLALLSVNGIELVRNLSVKTLHDSANRVNSVIASAAKQAIIDGDFIKFSKELDLLASSNTVTSLTIIDNNSTRVFTKLLSTIDDETPANKGFDTMSFRYPIEENGQQLGELILQFTTTVIGDAVSQAESLVYKVGGGGLLLLIIVSNLFGYYISSFLNKINYAASKVQGGDLMHRIQVKGNDELAEVGKNFNQMIEFLQMTENMNAGIVKTALDAIVTTDRNGKVIDFNPAAERIFGYTCNDIIGTSILETIILEEDNEKFVNMLHQNSESQNTISVNKQFEKEFRDKFNNRILGVVYITIIDIGNSIQYVIYFKDLRGLKKTEDRLTYLSYNDELTDLPNIHVLREHIRNASFDCDETNRRLIVLKFGLDRFKHINESLGHLVGDKLIHAIAQRLKKSLRRGDLVSRVNGDQFVICLIDVASDTDLDLLIQKYLDCFLEPFKVEGSILHINVSMGATIYPNDDTSVEGLLRNAESAMFRAKEKGGNHYQFFSREMSERSKERLFLENELRNAVPNEQFELHYQPQVELASGQIVGTEALIRWIHPEMGLVSPLKFIYLAEETGLIVDIGKWVIQEACRHNSELMEERHERLNLAINLSARQFTDRNLVTIIADALNETGHPPELLELEITESLFMENMDEVAVTLQTLSDQGIRVSMDDFGTGYSSLSYLKRFPISTLKIDRSFIQDITNNADNAAIVAATIQMAHSLNIDVVAEGVETPEELEFLWHKQCDKIQGFYFSRPLQSLDLKKMLNDNRQIALYSDKIKLISGES